MKKRYKLAILLGLFVFTAITAIFSDQEGSLKYGGFFCLAMAIVALARIFARPPGEKSASQPEDT